MALNKKLQVTEPVLI